MSFSYCREITVKLINNGNDVSAVMYWIDNEETWPYDEWDEEIELKNVKMMTEREIEQKIREELKKIVTREFDADKLIFAWEMGR